MMKMSFFMAAFGAVVFCGCATKGMKSAPFCGNTQGAESQNETERRVNLWPVAYLRGTTGSVIWPIVSFSDDHFAFRPVYSQYRQTGKGGDWDEFNFAWPVVQVDTYNRDYRVFPVFWGEDFSGCGYQAVFPLYWNGAGSNSLFPLWYYGSTTNSWAFHTMAGLSGARQAQTGYRCSWTFPLWYEDNEGRFSTLLYGQTKDSHWVFPLWYGSVSSFVSPIYARGDDGDKSWWSVPALLSWGEHGVHGGEGRWDECSVLLGFTGWGSQDGSLRHLHAFPLFSWSADGSWLTLLGGRLNSGDTTTALFTPLVGLKSGGQTGGWAFPVWYHDKDASFDDTLSLLDSTTLPSCIKVVEQVKRDERDGSCGRSCVSMECFWSHDESVVLLHDADHVVFGMDQGACESPTNKYLLVEHRKCGNRLTANFESDRVVSFDLRTRAKVADRENDDFSALLWFYQSEWSHDRMTGAEHVRHRVLWGLWDWNGADGDSSLDVFPGFTYDSRKDGYVKMSFFWRLFRYERNPESGTSVDICFIPIWR